ncbi:MAG TPA: hemolysin family protein [Vicinamibacterales bacterium]|nr:hemolysin family protein [Vicinamibacterales bacterium]
MPSALFGVALFVFANALYVAAEFGAVGARRSRVRRMAEDGNWLAQRLLPYVETPAALDRYVGASQIGITLSSLMLGAFAQATITVTLTPLMGTWFALDAGSALSAASVVVLVVLTAGQLIMGELVPKALALQYPTQAALGTVLPMQWSLAVFRPFLWLLNGMSIAVLKLLGSTATTHGHLHSPDEIELLIAESRDGGLLEPQEQQRLHRALRLGLRSARDLMVPLDRLTLLPVDAPWDTIVRTVTTSPFSRIPIYRGERDQIVGTLRVKDLVERYVAEGPVSLERLIRPLVRLAPDLPADRILALLRERRAHQAIVEAQGHALGLITIQDVLAELLGTNVGHPSKV